MTPERLAEIRTAAERVADRLPAIPSMTAVHHRAELLAELEKQPAAIEVTYGHQAYIFSQVTRIVVQPMPENADYALECAWHTDGTLTVVPSCTIRMVSQAEIGQINDDAEQRAEEADIMRDAGFYDPDYGKDLDYE